MTQISVFLGSIANALPSKQVNASDVFKVIKSEKYKNKCELIRKSDNKKEIEKLKHDLDYCVWRGSFKYRDTKPDNLISFSGLIDIDVDKLGFGFEQLNELKNQISNDKHCFGAFISPSGKGLKFIAKIELKTDFEENVFLMRKYYKSISNYLRINYSIDVNKFDFKCTDITRACFLSYDPDCFLNENSLVFDLELLEIYKPVEEPQQNKSKRSTYNFSDDTEKLELCINELKSKSIDITSGYDDWLNVGFSLASLGELGRFYYHEVSSMNSDYDYQETDKKFTNLIKSNKGKHTLGTFFQLCFGKGVKIEYTKEQKETYIAEIKQIQNDEVVREISEKHKREIPFVGEMEMALLGSLMLNPNHILDFESFDAECFYLPKHREIYKAIYYFFANGYNNIDALTIQKRLKEVGKLEFVGGVQYLQTLLDAGLGFNLVNEYVKNIKECYMKRSFISVANDIQADAFNEAITSTTLSEKAQNKILQLTTNNSNSIKSVANYAFEVATNVREMYHNKEVISGISTGFNSLDNIVSGLKKDRLIILAGRPGMGKTSFGLQIAYNIASDYPVAYFSLEMSATDLTEKLYAIESGIDTQLFNKAGKLTEKQFNQFCEVIELVSNKKLFIDDCPSLTIGELRAKARKLKIVNDIQLIVLDYIQLMSSEGKNGMNREQEISAISRGLKMISKELKIPVIGLSQLSRAVESRGGDKVPELSDLRDSGSLEQDADMVLFIHRPEYYNISQDLDGNPTKGVANIHVKKHRGGKLGVAKLFFESHLTKFHNNDLFLKNQEITTPF